MGSFVGAHAAAPDRFVDPEAIGRQKRDACAVVGAGGARASDTPDTAPEPARFGAPPMLSQAEAARQCGVSTATIRRARSDGRLPGAVEHRAELAEERERSARALAAEKERALEDARAWRRMIEAGPSAQVGRTEPSQAPTPAPTPQPSPVIEQLAPQPAPERPRSRLARWFSGR